MTIISRYSPRSRTQGDELRRSIARVLLAIEPGSRLPTIRQLVAREGASLGAIQEVLSRLESDGAFEAERRGRQGAVLKSRAIGMLWTLAEGAPLIVSLPLPTTPQIEGLATAIKALFADAGVEAYLIFSRGSRPRLVELWQGRCHVVVMSTLAARELCGRGEVILLELPAPSFVREHRVYQAERKKGEAGRPVRVVLDHDSVDFQRLTELEFQETGASFIEASYMEFPRLLGEGLADAVVWDVEDAKRRMPPGVKSRPLSSHVIGEVGDNDLRTAFVSSASSQSVRAVVHACLSAAPLIRIQSQVVDGTRVPTY